MYWIGSLKNRLPGLVIPLLLLLWWTLNTGGGRDTLLPSPVEVFSILTHPFQDQISTGSLAWSMTVSLVRISLGFSLAALIGIPIGLMMGASRQVRKYLSLMIEMARPLSAIALLPLSIILFKSETLSQFLGLSHLRYQRHLFNEIQIGMIFILFWGGVFPIILGTIQGVRSVRKLHLEAAHVLGARRSFVFRHVMIPSALPDIFHGLKLGIGRCWMVIIAAEMLPGTNSGIGYLIRYSYQLSRYDIMLACLVIVAIIGAFFSKGLEALGEKSLVLRSRER
ncbi:MAG: ABC transporter permease [Candidatus Fermentibacteraceae bacterium]|nr:ABC transporter permease [Candidatus Fermentibacteraceae bacterium]